MAPKPGNSRRMMEFKENLAENQSVTRSQLKRKTPGELLDITNQLQIFEESEIPLKRQHKDNSDTLKDSPLNHNEIHYDPAYMASGAFLKIPDEVVDKIFGQMNCEDKIAMSETCTRFNRIFSEPRSLKTIKLMADMDTHYFPTFHRRYQHVEFKNIDIPRNSERKQLVKKVFTSVGANAKNLTIHQSTMTDRYFSKVLHSFPNVAALTITNIKITETPPTRRLRILAQLQKLHIQSNLIDDVVELLHKVDNLTEVMLLKPDKMYKMFYEAGAIDKFEAFKPFIARQKHLKTLEMTDGFLFSSPFINCQFQLKKLVLFIPSLRTNQSTNLLNFLRTQNELEACIFNIAIRRYSPELQDSLIHILQLETLRSVKIIFYSASGMDFAFRDSTIVNSNVVDLYMSFRDFPYSHTRIIQTTSRMFPNLKQLRIKIDNEWFLWTSANTFAQLNSLENLESLVLENCDPHLITNLKLPKIKKFTMDAMVSRNYEWEFFFASNPTIEEISISYEDTQDESVKQLAIRFAESAILHLHRLQVLSINFDSNELTADFLNHLSLFARRNSSGALKKLRVCQKVFRL